MAPGSPALSWALDEVRDGHGVSVEDSRFLLGRYNLSLAAMVGVSEGKHGFLMKSKALNHLNLND